jgi:predicted TIM-barrel fold metal-dependent hydrolase
MNRADAERAFEKLVHQTAASAVSDPWAEYGADSQLTFAEATPLHDYLFHQLFAWADEYNTPVQFHVGYFEGSGNLIERGEPTPLTPLFLRYPRVRFALFHAAYPYWREAGALAKMFPNVFLDLCWVHILSPLAARRILDEWLDFVTRRRHGAHAAL